MEANAAGAHAYISQECSALVGMVFLADVRDSHNGFEMQCGASWALDRFHAVQILQDLYISDNMK